MIENLTSVKTEYISVYIGSAGLLIVSAIVLILCVCQKRSKEQSANDKQISAAESGVASTKVNDVKVSVNDGVSPVANSETTNGVLRNSGGSPAGGSSPHPPGTNQRELPQPPAPNRSNTIGGAHQRLTVSVNGGTGASNRNTIAVVGRNEEPEDDYDHLMRPGIKKDGSRGSGYDHVTIGEDGVPKVKERESKEQHRQSSTENDYAEVDRENIYEGVKDDDTKVKGEKSNVKTKTEGRKSVKDIEDPYASVGGDTKDELSDGSFKDIDPYARVRDYPYTKVKDDPYSKVKDQGESNASGGTFKDVDPYSLLKDESESGSGTFKDSDPYSRVKEYEEDPYNKVLDDPYNKVLDDPYNKVVDDKDDPYNRVKDDKDDPYNKVKDDPYNKVKDEKDDPYNKVTDEDPYNRVDDDGSASSDQINRMSYQYSTVNKVANAPQGVGDSVNIANGEFSIENNTGEYAQVFKNRDNGNPRVPTLQPPVADLSRRSDTDPYALPPEPPRRYNLPDDNVTLAVNVNPVTMPTDDPVGAGGGGGNVVIRGVEGGSDAPPVEAEPPKKKEPPYHKLTARESMASINARREMNTYEEVPENMYATVEGGSGDGVVTARANKSIEEHRVVVRNDVYSEIEDAGSRVPAPPSLDSLHLVTKTDCKNRLSAELEAHGERALADSQVVSPGATAVNRLSSGSTGVVNPAFEESDAAGVILDPNYQTVRDCIPDCDGDTDPNYESVEEAKSKAHNLDQDRKMMMERKKKLHVYEEVKPGESVKVRERALQTHMYEDLDGVKKEKEILEKNNDSKTKRKSDVWKRRSETEENERL